MYDKASLALIPSGNKASKLYSVLPANGNGDFNATRGSTATRVNKDGLIESVADDVPRLDYSNNADCPHLLLEPQSTNLVTDSSGGLYGNNPASEILTNAPDGTNTAVRPVPDSNSDRYEYNISGNTYSTDSKITYSWYRKRISTPNSTAYTGDLFFNILVNCTQIGSTTQIATNINGYDRFSATFNITDGSQLTRVRAYFGSIIGVGNSSIAYWGHQLEALGYSTTLIPTSGSTVTRSADDCNSAGTSAEFNDSEGVLFAEIAALANDGTNRRIAIPNTGFTALHRLEYFTTDNVINAVTYVSPSNQVVLSHTLSNVTQFVKIAYKYKTGDFALWVNGVEVGSSVSGNLPTGLTKLNFDNGSGSNDFYGKCKQLIYFNEALSDSELQTLTS
jgi:hypothetical protein